MSGDDFLSRWSRRKLAAKAGPDRPAADAIPAQAGNPSPPAPPLESKIEEPAPLPAVESLTPESDFTPFMRTEVDPGVRQQALRTLFRDARFNVMDGLDVYIDDYSKPDPIPPEWLGKLNQMARLGDFHLTEAARQEAEAPPKDGAPPEKAPEEQRVACVDEVPQSDTSAAGSIPIELKES